MKLCSGNNHNTTAYILYVNTQISRNSFFQKEKTLEQVVDRYYAIQISSSSIFSFWNKT